jgi:hypothetical protein
MQLVRRLLTRVGASEEGDDYVSYIAVVIFTCTLVKSHPEGGRR